MKGYINRLLNKQDSLWEIIMFQVNYNISSRERSEDGKNFFLCLAFNLVTNSIWNTIHWGIESTKEHEYFVLIDTKGV